MRENSTKTVPFSIQEQKELEIRLALKSVYNSLTEKGYNPVSQMVGYILSGDPSYITSHNGARSMISRFERDELLEFLLKNYLKIND